MATRVLRIELDDGVIAISVDIDGEVVEVMANFRIDNELLILSRLHVDGPGANIIGIKGLRSLIRDLGSWIKEFAHASEVSIRGATRTTGASPGRVPKEFRVKL